MELKFVNVDIPYDTPLSQLQKGDVGEILYWGFDDVYDLMHHDFDIQYKNRLELLGFSMRHEENQRAYSVTRQVAQFRAT